MIYGIMGAMPEEVDQLCAKLQDVTCETYAGVDYHRGTLHGKAVVVCCAGMGKANAASTVQVLCTRYGIGQLIFSGVAGNMTSKIGIGDVCVGETVVYHDADMDMLCQSAPFTTEYHGDPALVRAALDACAACGVKAIAGKIATGDRFVGDAATKQAIAAACAPDCVEMEGAAVSQTAARNGVPCVVLRAMSDNADEAGYEVLVVRDFSIAEYVKTATAIVAYMVEWRTWWSIFDICINRTTARRGDSGAPFGLGGGRVLAWICRVSRGAGRFPLFCRAGSWPRRTDDFFINFCYVRWA